MKASLRLGGGEANVAVLPIVGEEWVLSGETERLECGERPTGMRIDSGDRVSSVDTIMLPDALPAMGEQWSLSKK